MSEKIKIAVNGAGGRMGQRIIALASADADLAVTCAVENKNSPVQGRDAGDVAGIGPINVRIQRQLDGPTDVVIDFSVPESLVGLAALCAERQLPLVAATTGLTEAQKSEILAVGHVIPLILAPSMSLAVNLTMKLVRDAARALVKYPAGVDVEIIERHHRMKEDAPSGTALEFGRIVAQEMGQTEHVHGRHGRPGKRPRTEIGYHAVRVGDNVGEHTIVFGLMGESIDVHVRGQSRDSYAYGALAAAKFLVTKGPGVYSMADVLGLG
jgi:4-hydroxy-tetrahydrodipicolinate reductase